MHTPKVLGPEILSFCLAYVDDLLVASTSKNEHIDRLHQIFTKFRKRNIKIKISKCNFFSKSIRFLGVTPSGISQDLDKILPLKN